MRRNYVRQFVRWIDKHDPSAISLAYKAQGVDPFNVIDTLKQTTKFSLPDGGCVLDGSAIRILDDVKLIRLPYKRLVLEYNSAENQNTEDPGWEISDANKRILVLEEIDGAISLRGLWQFDASGQWCITPRMRIIKEDLATIAKGTPGEELIDPVKCQFAFDFKPLGKSEKEISKMADYLRFDLTAEWSVVLRFLAALACSNVQTRSLPVPRVQLRRKCAHPYDEYHELVLNSTRSTGKQNGEQGDRRTPREHLRRGHIRRLSNGNNIWVNAAVINAGVGGKVSKQYAIK